MVNLIITIYYVSNHISVIIQPIVLFFIYVFKYGSIFAQQNKAQISAANDNITSGRNAGNLSSMGEEALSPHSPVLKMNVY